MEESSGERYRNEEIKKEKDRKRKKSNREWESLKEDVRKALQES